MQLSSVIPKLARAGSIAAMILVVLTISWVVLLVYPSAPSGDVSSVERLAFIEQNIHWQTASFVIAALMAVAYIPVWLGLAVAIVPVRQTLGMIVAALGVLFSALLVVGYWTQYSTVHSLDQLRESNPTAAIVVVEAFDFSGNFWTASYGIVIAAFVLWGVLTLTVLSGLIDAPYDYARPLGLIYGAAGLLAIMGAIGFAAGIGFLGHGLMLSGIVVLPALGGTAIMLHQLASGTTPNPANDHTQASPRPVMQ